MNCPHDSTLLVESTAQGHTAHSCPVCHGAFVVLDQNQRSLLRAKLMAPGKATGALIENFKSPSTGQPMRRFEFLGVTLDYCEASNSVWFDKNELGKVLQKNAKRDQREDKRLEDIESAAWGIESILEAPAALFDGISDLFGSLDI